MSVRQAVPMKLRLVMSKDSPIRCIDFPIGKNVEDDSQIRVICRKNATFTAHAHSPEHDMNLMLKQWQGDWHDEDNPHGWDWHARIIRLWLNDMFNDMTLDLNKKRHRKHVENRFNAFMEVHRKMNFRTFRLLENDYGYDSFS